MGREQRVVVDSSNSDWLPVLSGVPQRSILGPMLFLCYINVMPICTQYSTTALFADDSKCFRPIHSASKRTLILLTTGVKCGIFITIHPMSNYFCYQKKKIVKFDYCMNDTVLCRTDSIKDLGIDISSSLVWNDHIRRVVNKCNKNGYDKTSNRVQCS